MSEADQILYAKPQQVAPVIPMSADAILYGKPEGEQKEGEQPQQDPGEIRAPTRMERVAMDWEKFTGGLFSSGPKSQPAHVEGVKNEWSDLPHMVGGLVAEMALNPGNILSGAVGGAAPKAVATTIQRGYAAYMLGQTAIGTKPLVKELGSNDVTGAQKAFDTFAYTLQAAMGLGLAKGTAGESSGAGEGEALGKELHGKTPTEIAQMLQEKAAQEPNPEKAELLKSASDQAQRIARMEPKEVKELSQAHKAWDDVLRVFAPAARGPEAESTAASLREHGGELAQRADRAEVALSDASKTLMKMPEDERWAVVDRIENGEPQGNEDLQGFADTARKIMDTKKAEIQALGTGKLDHFIEDYFPHIWKDPEKAADVLRGLQSKAPMLGPRSFLKARTIPTIAEGIAAGLEPISTNPVDLLLAKGREMDRYIVGQKWVQEMKDREFLQFVRSGTKPPTGYTEIKDPIATVYGNPSHPGAMQIEGKYMAPDEIASVANNYLSPGLRKSAAFRAYLSLANSVNQFQLGFSAFHLGFTTIDVATSKLALALEYGVEGARTGNLGMVGKAIGKAASVPISPITNLLAGSKGMAEWMQPGGHGEEIAKAIDMYRMGGGRAKMDKFYQAGMWKQMKNALKMGGELKAEGKTGEAVKSYASAAWKAPFAMLEQMGRPLMEYVVPRQKIGVALDMMRLEMDKLPASASVDQVRAVADKVVNSVDNRMGQMVYDNLFWNKAVKDIGMATVRSVGWNIGTIREVGGGILDAARFAKQEVTPKEKAEFTHRMAYTIALPAMTMMIGATYSYLRTGKKPEELEDYFFPKTGEIDPQGRQVRVQFPTYMKDIVHYEHDPMGTVTGKIHPMIGTIREMLLNKDFFGRDIRNEDDPFVQQLKQELTFAAKEFTPISIKQYGEASAAKQTGAEKAAAFVGVTRAPAWFSESKAEQLAGKLIGDQHWKSDDSPDSQKVQKIQQAKLLLREGKEQESSAILDGLEDAEAITSRQRTNIEKGTDHTYLENATSHLGAKDLMRVFRVATPAEREEMADKVQTSIDKSHLPSEDIKELQKQYDKLMGKDSTYE